MDICPIKESLMWYKVRNIFSVSLEINEDYSVSYCDNAIVIWDTLQVTHKGKNEVRQSYKNTLTQEYELFGIKHGETVTNIQKRSSRIVNKLVGLGKILSNVEMLTKFWDVWLGNDNQRWPSSRSLKISTLWIWLPFYVN